MGHYDFEKVDEFIESCHDISRNHQAEEAFNIISGWLDNCSDRYLNDFINGLIFIKYEKSLDWIEENSARIINVSQSWGQLAASSNFTWKRAINWLSIGRPLSLVALDGLMFCTTYGPRLNQSLWMRKLNPRLPDQPSEKVIRETLLDYQTKDNVHRTRTTIKEIIENIIHLEKSNKG